MKQKLYFQIIQAIKEGKRKGKGEENTKKQSKWDEPFPVDILFVLSTNVRQKGRQTGK